MNTPLLAPVRPPPFVGQSTLPHGTTGGHEQAWQRELEHALALQLPPGRDHGGGGTARVVAFLQGLAEVRVEGRPLTVVGATVPNPQPDTPLSPCRSLHPPCSVTRAAFELPRSAEQHQKPVGTVPLPLPGQTRAAPTMPGPQARPPLATQSAAAARTPVRVHADWSADGVRIWLGIDASGMAAVQPIASQLQRWLAAQGVRGYSIACNGQTIAEHWPRATTIAADAEATSSIHDKEQV